MDDLSAIVVGAAAAYANGLLPFENFQRTLALCSLWAQGVDKPSIEQIEGRISELNTASAFISAGVPE